MDDEPMPSAIVGSSDVIVGECDVYLDANDGETGKQIVIQIPGNLIKRLAEELAKHADKIEETYLKFHS